MFYRKQISLSLIAIALLTIATLFIAAAIAWPGSAYTYLIFSAIFALLLYFAFKRRASAGYVFLVVVLWIGFWLKLSLHILEPTLQWMEPTGLFNFSKAAWDEVAIVSTFGACGVLVGGYLFSRLQNVGALNFQPQSLVKPDVLGSEVQKKIKNFRVASWILGLGAVFVMIFLNERFNIVHQQVPPSVLGMPLHLQGLFNWGMGGGVFLLLMVPFYFEVASDHFIRGVALLLMTSVALGLSLFSRGTVVLQSLTVLAALFVYRDFLPQPSAKQLLQFVALIMAGVAISVVLSQVRREVFIASVQPASVQPASVQPAPVQPPFSRYTMFLILKLPIERWIGLEGVMAMSAHPGKCSELLIRAIKERRVLGLLDMYTHEVALSPSKDTKTVMYATPPSVFAFWYYSGNLYVVFIAVAAITIMLLAVELAIMRVSRNPFLSSAVGIGAAIQIVHMGTGGLLIPAIIFVTSLIFTLLIGSCSRYYAFGKLN